MSNPHLETAVEYYGCELQAASHVVLLVHGRGQAPTFMEEMIVRPLALDNVCYIAPTAANNTWYPLGFMADIEENEPWLSYTMECVAKHMSNLVEKGWSMEKLILAGFSQGACVVCEYASRYPQRYGGVVALTGGLIGPEGSTWPGESLEGTPVFLATSDVDPWIPLARANETRDVLVERGADVDFRVYPGMEHTVNEEEIEVLRSMINKP